MQVFKVYFKVMKKKIVSVVMYLVIFIGIAIALAMLGGEKEEERFTQTSLNLAVENLDQGKLGDALEDYLAEYNVLKEMPESEDALLDAIFSRQLDYVLYIPEDFTKRFVNGEREGLLKDRKVPSSSAGMYADNQIESYLQATGLYLAGGFSLDESVKRTEENLKISAEVVFADGEEKAKKPGAAYYMQYLPYIFICTLVLLVGSLLFVFNKKDLCARNKCSAMSFFSRNMQLIGASFLVTLLLFVLLILAAFLLYPDYMCSDKGLMSAINAFLMALAALAIAYLAAQAIKKEQVLNMISNVLGLGFAFLGGIFVPMELFSDKLLHVSRFIPTYWYVCANDAISGMTDSGAVPAVVWQAFVIETMFGLAVLAIGLMVNRMKARE